MSNKTMTFTAEDDTSITVKPIDEFSGCRTFEITAKNQLPRTITLAKSKCDCYSTIKILLAPGLSYFKRLKLRSN